MKKIYLLLLISGFYLTTAAQNKLLSMEDAILKTRTTLAPEDLAQLQFFENSNDYVFLKKQNGTDFWMRGNYKLAEASKKFKGRVEILDLRTLNPLDWNAVKASAETHGRVMVLTEEPVHNSFAESLAGRISKACFAFLDAPVWTVGAVNLPAVPLNVDLEKMMLPSADKVFTELNALLSY